MNPSLNIAITCYPTIGGSGVLASELGMMLAKRGHKVHFISYEVPFRIDVSAQNVYFHQVSINEYELFKYPDYSLPLAVKMAQVCKEENIDILHVHYAVPHAIAAELAKSMLQSSVCVITTLHGTDITLMGKDRNYQPIIQHAINNSCGVTAVSKNLVQETKKLFDINKNIEIIYNFFSEKKITKDRSYIRNILGIPEDTLVITHVSNLRPIKRIDDLLEIIYKTKHIDNLKFLIISGGNISSYMPLIHKYAIEDRIIIQEKVFDVHHYLNASDMSIYTSEYESFGLSILEAMVQKHTVLATHTGGISEVIQSGVSGFLYDVGDTNSFAKKIEELTINPSQIQHIGENAYKRAYDHFTMEHIVTQYEEYYYKVLNSKH